LLAKLYIRHLLHTQALEMAGKGIGKALRELLSRAASEAPRVVPAGVGGLAQPIEQSIGGIAVLAGAVGAVLVASGAIIRFLPGSSADLRQTATRMIEGGVILLAIVGTGALILGGANWLGQELAKSLGYGQQTGPVDASHLNPWNK
jgi:hypothetical protein